MKSEYMKYCCLNNERQGSCYFEFQKGKQDNWCFWMDDSLYLHADIVDELHISKLLMQVVPYFHYYGATHVSREYWQEVKRLSGEMDSKTQEIIAEIDEWVQNCFLTEKYFTLLGI